MSPITRALHDVQGAEGLPEILAAAYLGFERALEEIRARETPASPNFAALVMAAAATADGRDAVLLSPSMPWPPTRPALSGKAAADGLMAYEPGDLAAVFRALVSRLEAAASLAADPRDLAACRSAAHAARTAGDLLAGETR
jgi:hypothetical protein